MGECSVLGCSRPTRARGMCQMHYHRFMKNGTTDLIHKRGSEKKRRMSDHPLYNSWRAMNDRCLCITNRWYKDYGGRGIIVCERWRPPYGFWNFVADMGDKPSYDKNPSGRDLYSLDRIDVNGPYSPDNCRWASQSEQMNNTRKNKKYTVRGVTGTFVELARHFNVVPEHNSDVRFYCYGWPLEDALFTPLGERRRKNINGR